VTHFAISVSLLCAIGISAHAAVITVTNTNDSGPGSLRQALAVVNDGDAINFDSALNRQTITLTTAELLIDRSISIMGPGPDLLTVARAKNAALFRIFHVTPGRAVTIEGLTIQNGSGSGGGGVLNDHATLTIDSCIVSGNFAPDSQGAGLYNDGSGSIAHLTILNTTISGNQALSTVTLTAGGGIANDGSNGGSPTLTIVNSLVNDNLAKFDQGFASSGNGGGIYNNGASATLEITNSIVNNNGVGHLPGGSGQTFGYGGGIIRHCTIAGNNADNRGGGIVVQGFLVIGNTILKTGISGANIVTSSGGTVTSNGYNISNDNGGGFLTGPDDQINTDPILGPLQDNGGPTFTHALLVGSPAVDAGDPNFTPPPFFDQRGPGFDRVVNGRIDKGSFEVQGPTATSTPTATATPSPTPTSTPTPTPSSSGTPTPTPTATATSTPTATPTPRPTPTPRVDPSPRPRPTPMPRRTG